MLTIQTPLGTLRASKSNYFKHPGICIELQRPCQNEFNPLVLVEYANDEADLPDNSEAMITRVWQNLYEDEYSHRIIHENVGNINGMLQNEDSNN